MKAISIRQPWADLIARGIKDVENRTWGTKHRGWLLIHAGKAPDVNCDQITDQMKLPHLYVPGSSRLGAIVGLAKVTDCYLAGENGAGPASIWHQEGYFGWYLSDGYELAVPVEHPGSLSLFQVENALLFRLISSTDREIVSRAIEESKDSRDAKY